jgi:hypothetical protein
VTRLLLGSVPRKSPGLVDSVVFSLYLHLLTLFSHVFHVQSELKHSRAAMLATTGFLVQASGIHFPGMLSQDISFESLSGLNPVDQWEAVPAAGKAQIIGTLLIAEIATESKKPHYMMGGSLPEIVFPKVDFSKVSADTLKVKQDRELNNGRLAMIGRFIFVPLRFFLNVFLKLSTNISLFSLYYSHHLFHLRAQHPRICSCSYRH